MDASLAQSSTTRLRQQTTATAGCPASSSQKLIQDSPVARRHASPEHAPADQGWSVAKGPPRYPPHLFM